MRTLKISIQTEDFSTEQECALIRDGRRDIGALVTFSGLVREFDQNASGDVPVNSLYLEHYPGMTENSLRAIAAEAAERWSILDVTIIHRIGELQAGEQIVLAAVSSQHREGAFAACSFIMDFLKTRAPFWKKSRSEKGEHWVEAKQSDAEAEARWGESSDESSCNK